VKLIVGLGNPGAKYERTRHNVGFMAVDALLDQLGTSIRQESRFKALVGEGRIGSHRIVLAKPTTYMNLSGEAVVALLNWYKLTPADLVIIYDDFAIPLGSLRVRPDGSAGGHNGIRSIIAMTGTNVFPRIRVGIGPLPPRLKSVDFVLGRFHSTEDATLARAIERATSACTCLVEQGIDVTMQQFNVRGDANNPAVETI